MESYDILVIILSITLAVFLVVAIVATMLLIKLLKKVNTTTDAAKHAVDNVEQFTQSLKGAGRATAVGSTVAQIVNIFKKGRK